MLGNCSAFHQLLLCKGGDEPVPQVDVGAAVRVLQVVGAECPRKVVNMSLPDAPVITGTSKEVFDYYGLNAEGIAKKAKELLA